MSSTASTYLIPRKSLHKLIPLSIPRTTFPFFRKEYMFYDEMDKYWTKIADANFYGLYTIVALTILKNSAKINLFTIDEGLRNESSTLERKLDSLFIFWEYHQKVFYNKQKGSLHLSDALVEDIVNKHLDDEVYQQLTSISIIRNALGFIDESMQALKDDASVMLLNVTSG